MRKLGKGLLVPAMMAVGLMIPAQADAAREVRTLNDGWSFAMQGDKDFKPVNVPHTWNSDAYQTRNYVRGTGVYRRTVKLPADMQGKRILLKADGANTNSAVRIDGKTVGSHVGGYSPHILDITSYLKDGKEHQLEIEVNNSSRDIPPYSADFTFMGGLYRDVWLMAMPQVHMAVDKGPACGFKVLTTRADNGKWNVRVNGAVVNSSDAKSTPTVRLNLYAPDGSLVASRSTKLKVKAGAQADYKFDLGGLTGVQLWSPENPALYRVTVEVSDGADSDTGESYTAFRTFAYGKHGEFLLNDKPYKLRGVCRHQDQRPFGIALSDEQHRRDMQLIKDMGANFIRISHYPQDDAVVEMCDRLGLIAWEEIPVIDYVPINDKFADNSETMLREMIRSHYNHPSIAMWGYMNEILLRVPKEGEAETYVRTRELADRLDKAVREEDPSRPTTMAFHWNDIYHTTGISPIPDIHGWNIYAGWYGSDLPVFEEFLSKQHAANPDKPIIVSEYGAGSDRRIHSLNPECFDFSMEYQQKFLEHYVPVIEDSVYVTGGSMWNFVDFSSANRDESMPHINNKGLVTNDRHPKDTYYYYKAMWTDPDKEKVAYIATRDWLDRTDILDAGSKTVTRPVKVYSNLPEIVMIVNGKPAGRKQMQNRNAVFEVPMTDGANFIQIADAADPSRILDAVTVNMTGISRDGNLIDPDVQEVAFNVGSNCYFRSDGSGLVWLPDTEYSSTAGYGHVGGRRVASQDHIELTDDDPLYQHSLTELDEYRVDVVPGRYEVELSFAELTPPTAHSAYMLGNMPGAGTEGSTRMDVLINGKTVEKDFSPWQVSGDKTMSKRRYEAVVAPGESLSVKFIPVDKGVTSLAGLKIRKL